MKKGGKGKRKGKRKKRRENRKRKKRKKERIKEARTKEKERERARKQTRESVLQTIRKTALDSCAHSTHRVPLPILPLGISSKLLHQETRDLDGLAGKEGRLPVRIGRVYRVLGRVWGGEEVASAGRVDG